MKKAALLLAVFVVGVAGVMNVAIADKPAKVTVCQKTGSAKNPYVELSVTAQAAENGHWYAVGHCPDGGDDDDVVICHKEGGQNPMTMSVPESALGGHLGHGDTLGPCGGDEDLDGDGGGYYGGGGAFRSDAASSNPVLAATK